MYYIAPAYSFSTASYVIAILINHIIFFITIQIIVTDDLQTSF